MEAGDTNDFKFSKATLQPVKDVEGYAGDIFGIEWGSFGKP
jgi:hypothetical protein